ncbi:MAG: hypothetical protein Ta2G_15260 [Termitinemataceae bacterium]|nr:MAG: hypothetical protein Ta2G_15260 [Termitinemataceae bacterium]
MNERFYPVDYAMYGAGREDIFIFRKNDGQVNFTSRSLALILQQLHGCKPKEHFMGTLAESDMVQSGSIPLDLVEKCVDSLIEIGALRREIALSGENSSSPPSLQDAASKPCHNMQKQITEKDAREKMAAIYEKAHSIGLCDEALDFVFKKEEKGVLTPSAAHNQRIAATPKGQNILFAEKHLQLPLLIPRNNAQGEPLNIECVVQAEAQGDLNLLEGGHEVDTKALCDFEELTLESCEAFFNDLLSSCLNNKWVLDAVPRDISRGIEDNSAFIGTVCCGIEGSPYFERARDIYMLRAASCDHSIFHSKESYEAFKNDPRILSFVDNITVHLGFNLSDALFMLCGRAVIPPFYPTGSSSVAALGYMFRFCNPSAYFCNVPIVASRNSPKPETWNDGGLNIDEGFFNAAIVSDIGSKIICDKPQERLKEIGRRYCSRAALNDKVWEEYLVTIFDDICRKNIQNAKAVLDMYNGTPAWWCNDVESAIEIWQNHLDTEAEEKPFPKELKHHLKLFGEILQAWEELRVS